VILAALVLALLGGPSDPGIRTRRDAAVPIARAALEEAFVPMGEAAARTCGLDNRERDVEQLEMEYWRLARLVRPPHEVVRAKDGAIILFADEPVGHRFWPACKRSPGYHAYVIDVREALTRAREALGMGE